MFSGGNLHHCIHDFVAERLAKEGGISDENDVLSDEVNKGTSSVSHKHAASAISMEAELETSYAPSTERENEEARHPVFAPKYAKAISGASSEHSFADAYSTAAAEWGGQITFDKPVSGEAAMTSGALPAFPPGKVAPNLSAQLPSMALPGPENNTAISAQIPPTFLEHESKAATLPAQMEKEAESSNVDKKKRPNIVIHHHGRVGDPRMNLAVQTKLGSPDMTLIAALRAGGFVFPDLNEAGTKSNIKGMKVSACQDLDGVSLYQRRNQLLRRVRIAKKKAKDKAK